MPIRGPHPLARKKALRAVATVELTKGAVVLLAGFGVLSLVHRDVWGVADSLLEFLHLNPDRRYAKIFLAWADSVTDEKLMWLAALAGTYSILRFVEGYGLWRERVWAEWLALISGAIYLPFEIHDLVVKPTWVRAVIFAVNLGVVAYMIFLRVQAEKPVDCP